MTGYNGGFYSPFELVGFAKIGKNVRIHSSVVIPNPKTIEIGDNVRIDAFTVMSASNMVIRSNVHIGPGCSFSGHGYIEIGDYCGISHGCKFFTSTDDLVYADHSIADDDRLTIGDIYLERHATICANTVILPNVRIGYAAYIGAFSLVKSNIPRICIAAGVPARVLKTRPLTEADFADFERRCEERNERQNPSVK